MKTPKPEPLFLARETYRRRRVMDAARLLPFCAAFLFGVPVFWKSSPETGWGMLYLFGAWLILIVLAIVLARALTRVGAAPGQPPERPGAP